MLRRPAYLPWAIKNHGRARFDLATSGIPPIAQSELGAIPNLDGPEGWERLKSAIANHHRVPVAEVVPALGASHGLWLGYSAMIEPGDDVLVEEPAYEPLVGAALAAGASVRRFERSAKDGFALDPERVFAALTPETRVVAVTNLHNPTGVRASDEVLRAIAARLAKQNAFLFVDEVYAPFDHLVGPDGVFFGSARRLGANVVVTASLTKAYGLGPQRIGWVIGPERVIERATDVILSTFGGYPLSWMHRGVLSFEHVGALAERTRGLLGTKRATIEAWMKARPHIGWSAPQAGLFGFATLDTNQHVREAIERGIETLEVVVVPGEFFGIPSGFRLGWSLPEAKLEDALGRLDALVSGLLARA